MGPAVLPGAWTPALGRDPGLDWDWLESHHLLVSKTACGLAQARPFHSLKKKNTAVNYVLNRRHNRKTHKCCSQFSALLSLFYHIHSAICFPFALRGGYADCVLLSAKFFFFFLIPPSAFVFPFCHFPVRLVRRQCLAAAAMLPSPPCPLPWQRKHSSEQSDWFMISYMSSSSALTSPGKERLVRLNGLKTKSTVDWHPWSVPVLLQKLCNSRTFGCLVQKAEWTNKEETNGTWNNSKYSWCYTPAASSVHLDLETLWLIWCSDKGAC